MNADFTLLICDSPGAGKFGKPGFARHETGGLSVVCNPERWKMYDSGRGVVLLKHSFDVPETDVLKLRDIFDGDDAIGDVKKFQAATRGKYPLIYVDDERIIMANDLNGLGSVYLKISGSAPAVTDSMVVMRSLLPGLQAVSSQVGGAWMGQNAMTGSHLLDGVSSAGAGEMLVYYRNGDHRVSSQNYAGIRVARPGTSTPDTFIRAMCDVISGYGDHPKVPALSGGLDSRFLLALILKQKFEFATVSYGNNPDSETASKLASSLGLRHDILEENFSFPDDLGVIENFVLETNGLIPFSFGIKTRNISGFAGNRILFDGGFGELGRMQYAKKLLMQSYGRLKKWEVTRLADLLAGCRFDGFSQGFKSYLTAGFAEDLERFGEKMNGAENLSKSQFVQMISIRSRLPHFFGVEQRRLDMVCHSVMPFAATEVLEQTLGLSVFDTFGGNLYRNFIMKSGYPELLSVPLVKGPHYYRYPRNFYRYYKPSILKSENTVSLGEKLLRDMETYVRDRAAAAKHTKKELYDFNYLDQLISGFYNGESQKTTNLESWLTFDIWSDDVGFNSEL